MKRILIRVLVGLLVAAGLIYVVDFASIAMRIPAREQFATLRVDQLYTATNKWNEVEWSRGEPVMERCVNSLFPHYGSRPCWYVRRDTMHINAL